MTETPRGTPVGVDDPYAHADLCDHLTDDGRCRYAAEHAGHDPEFATERRDDDLRCPAADPEGDWDWADCPHFRSLTSADECARCGLEERRDAHSDARPLLEEHHLSYPEGEADRSGGLGTASGEERPASSEESERPESNDAESLSHEITVMLCRWCHAKVHNSFARVGDDVNPDPEALAAAEARRSDELAETGFETAAQRWSESDEG